MIRNTIVIHFEKEKKLFENGIKVLTLFFIKSDTSLFRGENPVVKNIFEEEYIQIRKEWIEKIDTHSAYALYLQNDFDADGNLQVHRSEERRVGKECRSRWSPDHKKKKK